MAFNKRKNVYICNSILIFTVFFYVQTVRYLFSLLILVIFWGVVLGVLGRPNGAVRGVCRWTLESREI